MKNNKILVLLLLFFFVVVMTPVNLSATVLNVSCSVDGSSPCPSGAGSINDITQTFVQSFAYRGHDICKFL